LGEEVVEDEVGLEGFGPGLDGVGPAVEEVEDGVFGFAAGVVAGRCVDEVLAGVGREAFDDGGGVAVAVEGAVGDVLSVPELGRIAGDLDLVAAVDEVGGDAGEVVGVELGAAVDVEAVGVDLGG